MCLKCIIRTIHVTLGCRLTFQLVFEFTCHKINVFEFAIIVIDSIVT